MSSVFKSKPLSIVCMHPKIPIFKLNSTPLIRTLESRMRVTSSPPASRNAANPPPSVTSFFAHFRFPSSCFGFYFVGGFLPAALACKSGLHASSAGLKDFGSSNSSGLPIVSIGRIHRCFVILYLSVCLFWLVRAMINPCCCPPLGFHELRSKELRIDFNLVGEIDFDGQLRRCRRLWFCSGSAVG